MTIRAFFDKGIYKNTVKRFSLGSVLYFITLFLCTGMLMLLAYEPDSFYYDGRGLILEEEFVFPSIFIAFFVPTIVALLVYRFVHSKKASIFTHSLPITRMANYISTTLGAFTLMALPVMANGVVLSIISLCGYGRSFRLGDVCIWVLCNLLVLFIMFSIAAFSAMCTGNSFAMIAINVMVLFSPLLIATITETVLLEFLFGYSYKRNLLEFAAEINPVLFLGEMMDKISYGAAIDTSALAAFLVLAVVLYVASGFIYKLRHTETSEEVAGFKVLNPVFKYFVAFVGTLAAFALFSQFIADKCILFIFIIILASIIFYFGGEMLLKKSIKVWRSYKGYLAFIGVFTAFILFLALTSVFGYETYVPKVEDIEEAAIYNYYYQNEEPFTKSEELNKYIVELHKDFVKKENRTILNTAYYPGTRIHITYKLKDGKLITRRYWVYDDTKDSIMNKVYEYEEYKKAVESIFNERIERIESVSIGKYDIVLSSDKLNELVEAMKKDVLELGYDKLHLGGTGKWSSIRFVSKEETNTSVRSSDRMNVYFDWAEVYITKHYENTFKWLDENGYGHVAEYVYTDLSY